MYIKDEQIGRIFWILNIVLLDPHLFLLTQIMSCDYTCWWIASSLILTKASLMSMSSVFVPVWQPPSFRDSLSGFLRCVVARHSGFISTHQLTVPLKLSGTSPDGSSKRGKGTMQSRTVDLAASSKSCCLKLGPWLCVSCFTVQASQAVGWIEFRHFGNFVDVITAGTCVWSFNVDNDWDSGPQITV